MLSLKPTPYLRTSNRDLADDMRGAPDQGVAQGQPPSPSSAAAQPDITLMQEQRLIIRGYLQDNGQLSDSGNQPVQAQSEAPNFRALIIAPQYSAHLTEYIGPLNNTLADVIKVYDMLITGKYGYKVGDIRILAEGLGTKTRPTRKNILKYLDWLVEAREQDHRFLHFSGHGTYFEATAETGKEAVVIDPKKTSGDNELDENKWRRTNDYQRIQYLDKSKVEMKYYQEAIVTSYVEDYDDELDELDDPNKHGLERLKKYVVYDKELNARMSKLPPGCKITCVFDCCHSGRMLNCNLKLDGGGFRGSWFSSDETDADDTSDTRGPISPVSAQATGTEAVEDSAQGWGGFKFLPSMGSAPRLVLSSIVSSLTPHVEPNDRLPEEEQKRDAIKADMIFWSACHQRQPARGSTTFQSGLFTGVFTEQVKKLESGSSVDALWKKINDDIKGIALKFKYFLQYAQVWTSLGTENEEEARRKLAREFTL